MTKIKREANKASLTPRRKKIVYLDNNGTTPINPRAAETLASWSLKAQNPSSASSCAKESREMLELAKRTIIEHCGATAYTPIFTSGATESNCIALRTIAAGYRRILKQRPTIIVSAIEHDSIMRCCESMMKNGDADFIYIHPNIEGSIPCSSIDTALRNKNVALVCVMFANNEIGTINNVREIGALAHGFNVPFMTDATQIFGKYAINVPNQNIDVLTASYHKFGGPMGLGLLLIRNELIKGYQLEGIINGHQQNGLRAGTENIPAIAAGHTALIECFKKRGEKNEKLFGLRNYLISKLRTILPEGNYADYVRNALQDEVDTYPITYDPADSGYDAAEVGTATSIKKMEPVEFVILGPPQEKSRRYLPNTLLFSVVKNIQDQYGPLCNVKMRNDLDALGVVCSIGSACNTGSKEKSHVVKAIQMPENVGRGILRVTMGDQSTREDINDFIDAFKRVIAAQIALLNKPPAKSIKDTASKKQKEPSKQPSKELSKQPNDQPTKQGVKELSKQTSRQGTKQAK